jgi:hypothetical protein
MLSAKNAAIATMISWFDAPTPAMAAEPSRATISMMAMLNRLCSMFSTIEGQASLTTSARIACGESTAASAAGPSGFGRATAGRSPTAALAIARYSPPGSRASHPARAGTDATSQPARAA